MARPYEITCPKHGIYEADFPGEECPACADGLGDDDGVNFEDYTLEGRNGNYVRIEYIGEGYNGDYDPEDSDDEPLLRFDAGQGDDSYGWCTTVPATVDHATVHNLARTILVEIETRGFDVQIQTAVKQFESMSVADIRTDWPD